jgi:cyclopropane fatty-acyl-phospholipid synthase-like methyltransferase
LDVAAGVDEMVDPIARFAKAYASSLSQIAKPSLLELGCGFGFGIDFATRILQWHSLGIEPGGYGVIGRKTLGVAIDSQLLGQGSQADATHYDCIYASEVLEHIENPLPFLHEVRSHLTSQGGVVMTTPCADFIKQINPPQEVYAALFPGEHKILLTRQGAEILFNKAGFQSTIVENRRPSNLVIQSSMALQLKPLYACTDYAQASREASDQYLSAFVSSYNGSESQGEPERIQLAMAFRLVKSLTNSARLDEAISVLLGIEDSLFTALDPDLKGLYQQRQSQATVSQRLSAVLQGCWQGMLKEQLLTLYAEQSYPQRGLSFLKTLGFFVCTLIHGQDPHLVKPELQVVEGFLETMIQYAWTLRNSRYS